MTDTPHKSSIPPGDRGSDWTANPFRPDATQPDAMPDAMESIEQAARIEPGPRTDPGAALSEDDRKELVGHIARTCAEKGIGRDVLARMAGLAVGVVNRALTAESPRGSEADRTASDRVLRRLNAVVNRALARGVPVQSEEFVMTGVAREVFAVVHAVDGLGRMGVIHGPSGIGKSLALRAVVELDFPSAVYIEANDACESPMNFYRAVLRFIRTGSAVPISASRAGNEGVYTRAAGFNRVAAQLRDSKRLLAVDEAENLQMETLNVIRQIHDATGCPVILMGRPLLISKLRRSQQDERIGGSIAGRIVITRDLLARTRRCDGHEGERLFTVDEVQRMLARYKVRIERGAVEFLADVACRIALADGLEGCGLRHAIAVFEVACWANRGADAITAGMVRAAYRLAVDDVCGFAEAAESHERAAVRTA